MSTDKKEESSSEQTESKQADINETAKSLGHDNDNQLQHLTDNVDEQVEISLATSNIEGAESDVSIVTATGLDQQLEDHNIAPVTVSTNADDQGIMSIATLDRSILKSLDKKTNLREVSKVKLRKLDDELIDKIMSRVSDNKRIRRFFDPWGRITVDRQVPYLCIYRRRKHHVEGDEKLVMGEAAYITAPRSNTFHSPLSKLVSQIASTMSEKFGSFLVVEVWVTPYINTEDMAASPPHFKIFRSSKAFPQVDCNTLEVALRQLKVQNQAADVTVVKDQRSYPKGLNSLISSKEAQENNIYVLGLEVSDVYRDSETNQDFPRIRQRIWRGLSQALKRFAFNFTKEYTSYRIPNFQSLGKRRLLKLVWEVDGQLADISRSFDLTLAVTPTNTKAAFEEFKRKGFEVAPKFLYRPIALSLSELKRQLHSIEINSIEDPALAQLFLSQQRGLDYELTLLSDRGTKEFLYGSLQLYGKPPIQHIEIAKQILATLPSRSRDESPQQMAKATEFAQLAEKEFAYYREKDPDFINKVEILDDIAGVMVSNGNLLISTDVAIARSRIYALLHHEVGTHTLTYHNGQAQPFKQLSTGLVGYDELQEGLGVLAEYLCGGLTRPRLRMLAGRVVAVQMKIDGASFVESYRELVNKFRFSQARAFKIVMRVFRGGGFTKDAVYLGGLIWLLDYFSTGGDIKTLLVGKIAKEQIPMIKELVWRKVVKEPILIPRYLETEESNVRLEILRKGITIEELSKQTKLP